MSYPLTQLDIKNALVFLNRVDLKGNESEALTDIKIKLQVMGQELQRKAQEPPLDGELPEKEGGGEQPPPTPPPPPPPPPADKGKK